MSEVFLLSHHTQNKILKFIQQKISQEGLSCKILKSPKDALSTLEECFSLKYKSIPRLKPLRIADFKLDPETYSLSQGKYNIRLRKKEFELLQFFFANKNKIINRNTILENVWGYNCNSFTNTVDVHIAALRKKINRSNGLKLRTIHGVGYRLET
jgi:hypothetical protein